MRNEPAAVDNTSPGALPLGAAEPPSVSRAGTAFPDGHVWAVEAFKPLPLYGEFTEQDRLEYQHPKNLDYNTARVYEHQTEAYVQMVTHAHDVKHKKHEHLHCRHCYVRHEMDKSSFPYSFHVEDGNRAVFKRAQLWFMTHNGKQPVDDFDPDHAPDRDTWAPVDLSPFLEGAKEGSQPSVGAWRTDDVRLLYPGKEHSVLGEMESGKSWLLCECAMQEIVNLEHVVYIHFEDADETDTVQRLIDLGLDKEEILEYFTFISPAEPVTRDRLKELLKLKPSLVILDGVNEAYVLHGWDTNGVEGAALFRQRLVKPFTRIGAATLQADHVTKDRDTRGRNAIGSVHKVNGITGSLIMLENKEPFGRGKRGMSKVYVMKDRPGYLRQKGEPTSIPGKTYMGDLVVNNTVPEVLDLKFHKPVHETTGIDGGVYLPHYNDDNAMLAILNKLWAKDKTCTQNAIYGASTWGKDRANNAIERLKASGMLNETRGSNRSKIFSRPTSVPGDVSSQLPLDGV